LHRALTSAGDQQGTFGGQPVEKFRFGFADEVAVRLMSRSARASEAELAELVAELATRTGAFRDFADAAVVEHLNEPTRRGNLRIS
jgi:hypothetical protein